MRWMRERDALIAQTLAFVQSVTGRREATGAPLPTFVPEAPTSDAAPLPNGSSLQAHSAAPSSLPQADGRPVLASEVKSEINARIAGFREHQERFNREREEYFATTLAKLRAAIKDGSPSRPRK